MPKQPRRRRRKLRSKRDLMRRREGGGEAGGHCAQEREGALAQGEEKSEARTGGENCNAMEYEEEMSEYDVE